MPPEPPVPLTESEEEPPVLTEPERLGAVPPEPVLAGAVLEEVDPVEGWPDCKAVPAGLPASVTASEVADVLRSSTDRPSVFGLVEVATKSYQIRCFIVVSPTLCSR